MKLCLVNPVEPLRRPIKELVPLLQRRGHDVGVLAPRRVTRKNKDLARLAKRHSGRHSITTHTYRALWPPSHFEWPIPLPGFFVAAWRVLRDHDAIQVWANFYLNNFTLFLLAFFFPRKRLILTLDTVPGYSFASDGILGIILRLYTKTLCKLLFWRADAITLYCESLLPYAQRAGLPMRKVMILPTGLTPYQRPSRREARRRVARELGVPERELGVLLTFIGLLNRRKGIDTILEVARQLRGEKTRFLIIGDGPHLGRYQRVAAAEQMNVTFLGYRHDKHVYLEASDLFLFPSRGEGLAGALMEAMHHGLAIVTTSIPCTTSLVRHGQEALLCAPGDATCFVKAVRRLAKDAQERRRLGRAAKRRIKSFDWQRLLRKYENIYDVL